VIIIVDQTSNSVVKTMDQWFSQAPALPTNAREALVKYMPIIALIFGIIGIILSLAGIATLTVLVPVAVVTGTSGYGAGLISAIFWLASSVLLLMAYFGMKDRKISGWNILFWSEIVYLIGSLITLSIISGLISALIGFYILFQIKPYYK